MSCATEFQGKRDYSTSKEPIYSKTLSDYFQLPAILRAILRDEVAALHKKILLDERHDQAGFTTPTSTDPNIKQEPGVSQQPEKSPNTIEVDSERVIFVVNKAVTSIMSRLNSLSMFDKAETNKMTALVQAASNIDNLCRMDPTWHPWL